jgi:hypothetical protein
MTYSSYAGVPAECARCGATTLRVLEGAFAEARRQPRDLGPGDHAKFVFDDPSAVAPFCARYLTEGVDSECRVVAALPGDVEEAVRGLLGADVAKRVDWHDSAEIYGDFDAERIVGTYESMIEFEPRTTRILAGPTFAEGVEPGEFDRYERLAHATAHARGATVVCLYDSRALSPELLEIGERRHTLAISEDGVRRNEQFEYQPV